MIGLVIRIGPQQPRSSLAATSRSDPKAGDAGSAETRTFVDALAWSHAPRFYLTQRATAAMEGRSMDPAGDPLNGTLDERMIGLSLEEFRSIKVRIAVAGGF